MTDASWDDATHRAWLTSETDRLLNVAAASLHPGGGFAWLDAKCQPILDRPIECWITTRMTHVLALGVALGHLEYLPFVEHGVRSLQTQLHDAVNGGWFTADSVDGRKEKRAYDHDFVVLAASSAAVVGATGARALLDEALAVYHSRFWDEAGGRVVDMWTADWSELEPYLGANANMHAVEALLAAADVTADVVWLRRALRIAEWFINLNTRFNGWRIPEHFTPAGDILPEYNIDQPGHPFRPYGATIGHAFEWSRLLLHLDASLVAAGQPEQSWLSSAARQLFAQAVKDGWAVDGNPGFVYTTDWSGKPVVSDRLHWVACEAIAAAAALLEVTGDEQYDAYYQQWWAFAQSHFVDTVDGSWIHQLDALNKPAASVWSGKPDAYHAIQACLLPRLPLAPSLTTSIAAGLLS